MANPLNMLPADLFESREIFDQVVGPHLLQVMNEQRLQQLLDLHLPDTMTTAEKRETLSLLLDNQLNQFNKNPLNSIYMRLKLQRLSPDLLRTLEEVRELKARALRLEEQKWQCKLLNEVMEKRRTVLERMLDTCPDYLRQEIDKKESSSTDPPVEINRCQEINSTLNSRLVKNAHQRYRQELKELRDDLGFTSSDEEEEEEEEEESDGDKFPTTSEIISINRSLNDDGDDDDIMITSPITFTEDDYLALLKKHKRLKAKEESGKSNEDHHPSMDRNDITLESIIERTNQDRVQLESKSSSTNTTIKRARNATTVITPSTVVKRRRTKEVVDKNGGDVNNSKQVTINTINAKDNVKKSRQTKTPPPSLLSSTAAVTAPPPPPSTLPAPLPATPSEVDSKQQTVSIEDDQQSAVNQPCSINNVLNNESKEITCQDESPSDPTDPPSCFFSLIRNTFKTMSNGEFRLGLPKLEELIKEQLEQQSDSLPGWNHEHVKSAMNFLSCALPPPQILPLVDYREKNQQWHWIGSNRDQDSVLIPLCEQWQIEQNIEKQPTNVPLPIPMPRCPTDWIVRPSTEEEKQSYRVQEAKRYQNPNLAFTFVQHGYSSVVGPVKGCGIVMNREASIHCNSPNKAREHNYLTRYRPQFVTLLSIVRDSAARLPNGEGTRADICEMLRDSQYLLDNITDQQVNTIVSGALDRLHYEKDPCVKYDVNRRIWIYLHRNRSEKDFERLHKLQLEAAKAKRNLSRTQRNKLLPALPSAPAKTKTIKRDHNQSVSNTKAYSLSSSSSSSSTSSTAPNSRLTTPTGSLSEPSTPLALVSVAMDCHNSVSQPVEINSRPDIGTEPLLPVASSTSLPISEPLPPPPPSSNSCDSTSGGTLVPISLNAERGVTTTVPVTPATLKTKKTNKRKLTNKCGLNSISGDKDNFLECENTKIKSNGTLQATLKQVKSRPVKKSKRVTLDQQQQLSTGVVVSESDQQSKTNGIIMNSSDSLPLNGSMNGKTAVIIAKPVNKSNTNGAATTTTTAATATLKLSKQIQIQTQPGSTQNSPTTHRISIPTSMFFNQNSGSVVLASNSGCFNGIKSFVMSTSGGQIVLHPQNLPLNSSTGGNNVKATSINHSSSLPLRSLQGIRVFPVSSSNLTLLNGNPSIQSSTQAQGNVVARIIATNGNGSRSTTGTTGTINNTNLSSRQILIPSASSSNGSLQPLIISAGSTATNMNERRTPQIILPVTHVDSGV